MFVFGRWLNVGCIVALQSNRRNRLVKGENEMNLYLLSQTENNDWDTFDSCVVAAKTEKEAASITPGGCYWMWASCPEKVTVEKIGIADKTIEKGIILVSFNAG